MVFTSDCPNLSTFFIPTVRYISDFQFLILSKLFPLSDRARGASATPYGLCCVCVSRLGRGICKSFKMPRNSLHVCFTRRMRNAPPHDSGNDTPRYLDPNLWDI